MSGGAFRNTGNLISRNRQLDEYENTITKLKNTLEERKKRLGEIDTALVLLEDDKKENAAALEKAILAENTAGLSLKQAKDTAESALKESEKIKEEERSLENELSSIKDKKRDNEASLLSIEEEQKNIRLSNETLSAEISRQNEAIEKASDEVRRIELAEGQDLQKVSFVEENINRLREELSRDKEAKERTKGLCDETKKDSLEKQSRIKSLEADISVCEDRMKELSVELSEAVETKDTLDARHKGFFEKKSSLSDQITALEKELYRLQTDRDKAKDSITMRTNYMWEEYELTRHAAMELKDPTLSDADGMRRLLTNIRESIRSMGSVNVNAIEEYTETKTRYDNMKKQHDDIVEAKKRLEEIILELDTGMRRQFEEGFKDIQREFDSVFKQLFGGGKGTLSLTPGEDILETGISIVAQPPGKKLQNMMQLSGGEKSLTAIALLFAIQNLKPSPFCLLDEIEAALDDSNVGRFANYLHKLTKHTQFIVITHRRGTMNAADRLYGITMQEKGISTLVSVKLIEDELDE